MVMVSLHSNGNLKTTTKQDFYQHIDIKELPSYGRLSSPWRIREVVVQTTIAFTCACFGVPTSFIVTAFESPGDDILSHLIPVTFIPPSQLLFILYILNLLSSSQWRLAHPESYLAAIGWH